MDIELPDGTIAEFPDDMPMADIEKVLQRQFAPQKQEMPKKDVSALESGVRGYVQGGSLGFGDEIMGGLASGGLKLAAEAQHLAGYIPGVGEESFGIPKEFEDRSIVDMYREGRGIAREQEKAAREANPWTYGLSEVGGGVITGAKLPLPQPLSNAKTGGRVLNAMAAGGAGGGAYGLGASEADLTKGEVGQAVLDTGKSAVIGAAAGGFLQGVAEKFARSKIATPRSDEIKSVASQAYKDAEEKGGMLTEKFTNSFIRKALANRPQTQAGRIVKGDDEVTKLLGRLTNLRNQKLSLRAAQEIDEALGDMVDGLIKEGRVTKEGKRILDLQTTFRNMIDNAPEGVIAGGKEGFSSLKEARRLWSASAKMRDIEKIVTRAEMMQVPATGIKTGFRTLYNNPKRMRGFSEAERKLIKKAAETGKVGDLLNTMGSRLVGIVTLGAGGGPLASGAAYLGSAGARSAAGKLQVGKADRVAAEIAKNALGKPQITAPQAANYGRIIMSKTGMPWYVGAPLAATGSGVVLESLQDPKRQP